jgi:hypothetical protein
MISLLLRLFDWSDMSTLVPSGDAAQQQGKFHELQLGLGAAIVLAPDDGHVILGGHRIPARNINDDWELHDTCVHFEVNGKMRYYRITIHPNRAEVITEVSRWHADGSPAYYHGEDHTIIGLRQFIRFVVQKLLPDLP